MRRYLIIAALLATVILVLLSGIAIYLLHDESFLKQQLGRYSLEFTGRELVIDGALELSLGRETTIVAGNVRYANANWADKPDMVRLGLLKATIDVPSLFSGRVYIPSLELDDCHVELLENSSGEANWDLFPDSESPAPEPGTDRLLPFALNALQINDCRLVLDRVGHGRPLDVRFDRVDVSRLAGGRAQGLVAGSVNGEELTVDGWLAPVSAFRDGGELRHELHFRAGEVTLDSAGSIADAAHFGGADISGRFRGPDIARVLRNYALPPMSEGSFDFRLDLATRDGMVHIDVDGDLGSLDLRVDGAVDRLLDPGRGSVTGHLAGPDLQALGRALGRPGLVAEAFEWHARADFDGSVVRVSESRLETGHDRIDLSGAIETAPAHAGSSVEFSLHSTEIGRWAPLLGKPEQELGALDLRGHAETDANGLLSVNGELESGQSRLRISGVLGPATGPFAPDVDFRFHSDDMPRLAAILGRNTFPARPFDLEGSLHKQENRLRIENLALSLDRHRAVVDGHVNLVRDYAGSQLDIGFDIPDLSELGLLFGLDELPAEPLRLDCVIAPEGKGFSFQVSDGNLGEIEMELAGRIADMDQPLGIDADFNVYLPGLHAASLWLPDIALPDGPFMASGALRNLADHTRLRQVRLQMGQLEAAVDGRVGHDRSFDITASISGPDVSVLNALSGTGLPALPFDVAATLQGTPTDFRLEELQAGIGESRVVGRLEFGLGEVTRITGELSSPFLDLDPFTGEPPAKATEPGSKPLYLFDETPVVRVADLGLDVDTRLSVNELKHGPTRLLDIDVGLKVLEDRIRVAPFFLRGLAGGTIEGSLNLESGDGKPHFSTELQVRNLRGGFLRAEGQDPATLPLGQLRIDLDANGFSRREMAAGLNGEVRMHFGSGEVASARMRFLTGDFISELLNVLNPFSKTSRYTPLECLVAGADIKDGTVTLEPVVFRTNQLTVISQGRIDLETERIDLTFNSKSRKGLGISASDLVNPFVKVGGTLAAPALELDPAGTVVKGGIAVATGGLSILARSMVDRFLSSRDPCGDALAELAERDGRPSIP